ncbi:MAG: HAMP domain-containing histidine kinase [Eubacterium sp.]|nr:HAMP domain-containing histidine kinase [Eubacterium sp.]
MKKLSLSQKNLFYSLLLAAALLLFFISYMIWMLPSLYVSYTEEQNLEAIKKQHRTFMETGTYSDVSVKNPTACVSIRIPFEKKDMELISKMVSVRITPTDPNIQALAAEVREFLQNFSIDDWVQQPEEKAGGIRFADKQLRERVDRWQHKLADLLEDKVWLPVQIEVLQEKGETGFHYAEDFRIHIGAGDELILESAVSDRNQKYTNYLAVEKTEDGIVFSVLPVITPQMEEIRPIVMQSVPMLCAVILLLVLAFSQIYSNGIVQPAYQKLQDSNRRLLEENERQEMFLRATSHQLKTPITAALLLLDGMIGKIGKYCDRDKYLPKVKEQLLSMRRMVEEILSLNRSRQKADFQKVQLYGLVQAQADSYRLAAAEKRLQISIEGEQEAAFFADAGSLARIIDNLLSNAVAYTPSGGSIVVALSQQKLVIRNEGTVIPKELLPHIFEPFVHGEQQTGSHGLGLYIAAYYARMMHMDLSIRNQDHGVEAVLQTTF